MKIAGSMAVFLLLTAPLFAAPPKRSDLPEGISLLIHVDVDSLQSSRFGRGFVQKVVDLPLVQKHIASMPSQLMFLKDVQVNGVTIFGYAETKSRSDDPVVLLRWNVDEGKLVELLRQGRDYARVSYEGVQIHHWMSNMEAIGDMVLDRPASEEADDDDDKYRVAYLAMPSPGVALISTSLTHLTAAIDRQQGRGGMLDEKLYKSYLGGHANWFTLAFDDPTSDFPSNVIARVHAGADDKIHIHAETKCRNKVEREIGQLAFAALSNAEQLGPCLAAILPAKQGGEAKAPEKPSKKRRGSLNFGVTVDKNEDESEEDKPGELNAELLGEISKFLTRLVKATFEDDRLVVTADAYPGSWDVKLTSDDKTDAFSVVLNLFSTKEKLMTARAAADSKRR